MKRLGLALALFAQPALADPEGYDHTMNWGYGAGMMFGPVLWLIVLGLIVAAIIWFVRRMEGTTHVGKASAALTELDLRFARGEIDADDYTARKKLLIG
ncbi:putative membrane protein [Maritimibacter alkaliphilus HTCC2654]|uniref:SHOCT domain-containing protein n=1 Tax=Maritimibacter alkaliphilus HTCC2654 TaxID=314271 RepID=A3VEG8_9RHOB|nr:hypothetical protein [Maritimibacter alkaliphilus]EAQ13306.1 hypothetical protein RB2654_09559 [Rhodobacterales bacterium HTCC2654] [Maritimibacter alkaliphilus HTCC2654]TYP85273.1 putative membrane protein [Maritimibacter alkaliphilus HTCC2654]